VTPAGAAPLLAWPLGHCAACLLLLVRGFAGPADGPQWQVGRPIPGLVLLLFSVAAALVAAGQRLAPSWAGWPGPHPGVATSALLARTSCYWCIMGGRSAAGRHRGRGALISLRADASAAPAPPVWPPASAQPLRPGIALPRSSGERPIATPAGSNKAPWCWPPAKGRAPCCRVHGWRSPGPALTPLKRRQPTPNVVTVGSHRLAAAARSPSLCWPGNSSWSRRPVPAPIALMLERHLAGFPALAA